MLYSVITINYNNREGLRSTVESVVGQTFQDFEFIIIDGGSKDRSVDVIKEYEESITYWVSERDRGIYHAMNKGIAQAKGDYCIFMNSGDCFYNHDVLRNINNKLSSDIVIGKVAVDDNGNTISPPPDGDLTFYHLYSGAIPHQGSFIKTELLRKYPYDENLKISSDWKFFVQTMIWGNCSVSYIDDYVAKYDMEGLSSANPEMMRREKEKVLSEMFPPRLLADYQRMKQCECSVLSIAPELRRYGRVDRLLYRIGRFFIKFVRA